jgi:DNA-binding CsgD family transcriptional regulator
MMLTPSAPGMWNRMGKRRRNVNDPTFRLATRDNEILRSILDTLSERQADIIVRYIAKGESATSIGKFYGISPGRVRETANWTLKKMRHLSRSKALGVWDSAGNLIDGDYVDIRPGFLGAEEYRRYVCEHCSRRIIPTSLPIVGGRPPKYCSDACKQAASRSRRARNRTPQKPA